MKTWNTNFHKTASLSSLALLCMVALLFSSATATRAQHTAHSKEKTRRTHNNKGVKKMDTVVINGVQISQEELDYYAEQFHQRIPSGNYWYDSMCGAWGRQGGPTLGFTLAGLPLGGPLRSKASHGNTGVFVNGRELPWQDVLALQQLGLHPQPGRVWLNANGDFGPEGSPFILGNVLEIVQQAHAGGRGYGSIYSSAAEGSVTSDGEGHYIASFRDGHGGYIGHSTNQ